MASIRELRQQRHLTQGRLAELAGLSSMTILKLEHSRQKPSPSTAHAIAQALGVDIQEIDFPLTTHIDRLQARTRLSDRMLCRKAGISMAALSHLRTPHRRRDAITAMKIAKALDVSAAEILGLDQDNINELKRLRLAKGLTVSELSRRTGISRQTIHNLEDGHYHPSEDTIRRLSKVLEVAQASKQNTETPQSL